MDFIRGVSEWPPKFVMKLKSYNIFIILFIVTLLFGACSNCPELEGTWIGYADGKPPADWTLIGSGLDLNRFANIEPVDWRKRLTTEPHRVLLICAARLDWPKRQDVLIEAVAQLIADGRKLNLILLGTGKEQEHLATLAAELGIVGHVHFLGYQPNEVVPASLLGADVICTPTDWEAFPILRWIYHAGFRENPP